MNNTAKINVTINPEIASKRYPPRIAACAHVNEAPDVRRSPVFNNGISHGLITSIPFGGHTQPISGTGFKLEWKYPQKKEKNNITSDTMKSTIPKRSPCCTAKVCAPS